MKIEEGPTKEAFQNYMERFLDPEDAEQIAPEDHATQVKIPLLDYPDELLHLIGKWIKPD